MTSAASSHSRKAAFAADDFSIGGTLPVRRLGFGAMQITGPGIWGPPADPANAVTVLRRAVELGVNFIDTADSYGPTVSEELIATALYPYDGVVVATKAGLTRTGPGEWHPVGLPEYLKQQCELSLRRLRIERIELFQLHRIDKRLPWPTSWAHSSSSSKKARSAKSGSPRSRCRSCGPHSRSLRWRASRTSTT